MSNKHNCCFTELSGEDKKYICESYKSMSQAAVCVKYNITKYALIKVVKDYGVYRTRYGNERNKLLSQSLKNTLQHNRHIVENRIKIHLGSKRSLASKQKMRLAAWNRISKQPKNFVSKIETKFGYFISKKLNLSVVPQFRVEGKPFDFLVDNKMLVEFDGPHHYVENYFLWKDKPNGFQKQQERDVLRKDIAFRNGYKLFIVRQSDVNRDAKLFNDLMHCIMGQLGHPPP
jgi:very-short-patch-repair endonuclease